MKASGKFIQPSSGIERKDGPPPTEFSADISNGKRLETSCSINQWGVRAVRITGGGEIALIPDSSDKLNNLVRTDQILVSHERTERKYARVFFRLSPPNPNARIGSMGEYWHTTVNPKDHTGVTFHDLQGNRFHIVVEW